jgi:replicative superfamily II helicase
MLGFHNYQMIIITGGLKMVNFKKRISNQRESKRINPIEIYEHLDRASDTGELRGVQKEVLEKWLVEYRNKKNTILKLHTGQGKTLIGLLMLQSYLNETQEPCVYLCPNNYLMDQTCEQAERFGIPFVTVDKDLPDEFLEGEKILITSCQIMFNGLTKFKLDQKYIKVHSIVLDDAHACAEIIKDSFKLSLEAKHELYKEIISLFTTSLKAQGVGTFTDIENGEYDAILQVPYWEWQNKHEDITRIISKYNVAEDKSVIFIWPLIKDIIKYCTCVVSGKGLEIYPEIAILERYGSYYNANSRIFMSATVSDDSLFVKDLDVDKEAVLNPLSLDNEKWNGEKMILIPQRIDSSLKEQDLRKFFASVRTKPKFGIAVLTPSFPSSGKWANDNVIIVKREDIFDRVGELKGGIYGKVLVFSNRYDGIDLPDNACRILIIDGKPSGASIEDMYYEMTISNSDVLQRKCAQKIEQGLGRSVRGEKDYSAIVILNNELIKFLRSTETQKYFSDQSRTQIKIGMDIVGFAIEDMKTEKTSPMDAFVGLINQSLKRDDDWKDYYEEQMSNIKEYAREERFIEIFDLERRAEEAFIKNDFESAKKHIQSIIDMYYSDCNDLKGWYLQKVAKYIYLSDPTESNLMQVSAHKSNPYVLKPKTGMEFKRLEAINAVRIERINEWIKSFDNFEQMILSVNENISLFDFGVSSEKFEKTVDQIGISLGFMTERPEKKWKDGSDNLWRLDKDRYLLIECKNEVKEQREEIYKKEAGQINTSCAWFKGKYPESELYPLMIINAKKKGHQVHFNENVKIMNRIKMELFKANYHRFFNSFKDYDLSSVTTSEIQKFLEAHNLTIDNIINNYSVEPI